MIRPRYRALLVDHDPVSETLIRTRLARSADLVVDACRDAASAVSAVREHQPDVLLLDASLPPRTGFQILAELGESPVVVLLATRGQDTFGAFGFAPVDCLIRPFTSDRLDLAMDRARHMLRRRADAEARNSPHGRTAGLDRNRFLVGSRGRMVFVHAEDVQWISASANYIRLHTADGSHRVRMKIGEVDRMKLPGFMRVHRTALVNERYVDFLSAGSGRGLHVHLVDGSILPVSATYREQMLHSRVLNRRRGR